MRRRAGGNVCALPGRADKYCPNLSTLMGDWRMARACEQDLADRHSTMWGFTERASASEERFPAWQPPNDSAGGMVGKHEPWRMEIKDLPGYTRLEGRVGGD